MFKNMAHRVKSIFYLFSVMLISFHSINSKSLSTTHDTAQNTVMFHKNSEPPDLQSQMESTNTFEEPFISVRINKRAVPEISAPVAFECQSRQPLHALQGSIKDKETRTPFIITVDPSAVKSGDPVSVTISAIGGHAFRGMILQAVPGEGSRTGAVTGGKFLPTPGVNLQSCYSEDDTVTLGHHRPLEHLELKWASSPRMNGDFYFIGTFVEDYETFWANVISNPFTLKPDVQQGPSNQDTELDRAVHDNLNHNGDTGKETTQDMLVRNGVIAVEKLGDTSTETGPELDDLQSIFGSDVRRTGNDAVNVDDKIEEQQSDADASPDIDPPPRAEFISSILGALGGGGGGGGVGGLGSMMNLMKGLGGLGGVTSLLGGGKASAPAPPPVGLPPRTAGNEPSLADLLGVDPASVVDTAPAAVPSRPSSGGGGLSLGKVMGGLGALGALRTFMKSRNTDTQPQQPSFGGGFGGARPTGMQQQPSMQTIMQQLQMQQMQIASLQSMLGQGSVTNTMMGGFGHSPSSTFGQQATNQMMGTVGQRPGGFQGTNTGMFGSNAMTNGFNRQPTGGNQITNNFGGPQQQFPANGMLNNRPVQNTNQFAPNTNTFGQGLTPPAPAGQDQLMQELIRQNQLLMQQNQQLRSGPPPAGGGQSGFGGQTNMNNGMANTGQNMNNNQGFNNNNPGFNGGTGFGQNGNFGTNNNAGQNPGFGNNGGTIGSGMNGNFGQNHNSNNNAGNFGQNQNMNNNGGMNMGNNAGQNGFGNNNNLNNQNMGHNTNNHGNFGQNGNMMGNGGMNGGNNGHNTNMNQNAGGMNPGMTGAGGFGNGGMNGDNNGHNTNMNQNAGGMNPGMTGAGGFGNQNNMNNGNNFGGNPGGNNGFGGLMNGFGGQSPSGGSNPGSSGMSGGLAGMFGGSSGNDNSNPLGGLLGGLGGGGGGGGLSSMLGMLGGGGGGGGPDISSLLSGVDTNAMQGLLQGEEGADLMNSMNQLMSTDTGGTLMNAMQGIMSGDMSSLKDIQGIMNGKDGAQLMGLAEQARGLMSQGGINPDDLTALLGR